MGGWREQYFSYRNGIHIDLSAIVVGDLTAYICCDIIGLFVELLAT
jgi:hypothetical protein